MHEGFRHSSVSNHDGVLYCQLLRAVGEFLERDNQEGRISGTVWLSRQLGRQQVECEVGLEHGGARTFVLGVSGVDDPNGLHLPIQPCLGDHQHRMHPHQPDGDSGGRFQDHQHLETGVLQEGVLNWLLDRRGQLVLHMLDHNKPAYSLHWTLFIWSH